MLIKSLKKFTLTSFAIALTITACSSTKDMSRNQKKSGHYELYSYPKMIEPVEENNDRYRRLVVIGLNDFNGQLYPQRTELELTPQGKKFIYSGGITAAKSYLDILRTKFKDQTITLDAGSFLSKRSDHEKTIFLYNYLGLDAVNLGKNELNLITPSRNYPHYLEKLFKKAKFEVLSSNIYDLKTGEQADWKFLNTNLIKEINGVKVGIIGVNSQKSAYDNISKKLNGIYFQNLTKIIILNANKLRRQGAEAIILLAHHGIDCTSNLSHNLRIIKEKINFNQKDISGCESTENELIKTLSLIPPNKVDLIITGGVNSKVANTFYDIPVLQNFSEGQYLSWAELYYDTKYHRILKEKSKAHHPIQLCHQFFEKSQDCFIEKENLNDDIVTAKFLGKKIQIRPLPNK